MNQQTNSKPTALKALSDFPVWVHETPTFIKSGDIIKSPALIRIIQGDGKLRNKTRELKQ